MPCRFGTIPKDAGNADLRSRYRLVLRWSRRDARG
jgi:hypothetical protein